jgi:hypothetical protein
MKALADIVPAGQSFGQMTERVAGLDEFVLTTLCFLGFLFGAFVAAAIVLWRRQAHPEPHRRLLMEMDEENDRPQTTIASGGDDEPPPRSWEREADWWKK